MSTLKIDMIDDAGRPKRRDLKDVGKEKPATGLSLRAQSLLEGWCQLYEATYGIRYYPSEEDEEDAAFYSKFVKWEEIKDMAVWFLKYYLKTPLGKARAERYRTIFAPTLSLFLRSLNDIPLVEKGFTPFGYYVDDDGEVGRY